MSSVALDPNTLFDTVTVGEAAAGDTEYRCFYVFNDGDEDFESNKLWIQLAPTQGVYAIAAASEGVDGEAQTVADESTAPTGETFTAPGSAEAGIEVGPLEVGQFRAVWARRSMSASTPGVSVGANPSRFRLTSAYIPAA